MKRRGNPHGCLDGFEVFGHAPDSTVARYLAPEHDNVQPNWRRKHCLFGGLTITTGTDNPPDVADAMRHRIEDIMISQHVVQSAADELRAAASALNQANALFRTIVRWKQSDIADVDWKTLAQVGWELTLNYGERADGEAAALAEMANG